MKRRKNVVWMSADGRVTSDHCRVTVQRLFSKFSQTVWNVQNVVWQSADVRVTSDHCRVTVQANFLNIFPNCLKCPKNVVWQSADSRVTTDYGRVTLQWLFTKSFLIAWNVQKRCLTVSRRSRDLRPLSRDRSATFFKKNSNCLKRPKTLFDSRPTVALPQPLSRDRSATFFKIFPNRLKHPKNVVWQSSDGRVTSDHCRVTVQRLFSKTFIIASNVQKTLFDSRPTVASPPT